MEPIELLRAWWLQGGDDAMTLATAAPGGRPSARVVLLKQIDGGELVFGTSLASRKGRELLQNPQVACVLHWPSAGRQARVEGVARVAGRPESEALWATRGRDARIVDHVSDEGAPMDGLAALRDAFSAAEAELDDEVPCPEDWAAVRIAPTMIELWESGERRQAERRAFLRDEAGAWGEVWLWP
jgi:pyridoxamine 5'-phosphate oxidase